MIRSLFTAACLGAIALAAPAHGQAHDVEDAKDFVESNARDIIAILQDMQEGERSVEAVKTEFRERIDELDRITNFVLGRYRRTADEDTLDDFRTVFREFAINVYERELSNYAGQTLTVTGAVTRDSDDWIVRSQVTGGPDNKTWDVNWRVQERDSTLKVLDAQVAGVWLAQTQRDQITSIIGNHRGRVGAAIGTLCSRIGEQENADMPDPCANYDAPERTGR